MELELNASDGCGLISPELAQVWSDDMHLDYLISGCCVRHAFTKGMVATFDFREFARVHGKKVVKDVWGKEHNIDDIISDHYAENKGKDFELTYYDDDYPLIKLLSLESNMSDSKKAEEVINCLKEEMKNDKLPSKVYGMTKLGLCEMSRMKVKPPLYTYFKM